MPSAFIDTNILVYAADESAPLARKTTIARKLLRQKGLCISVQVLNEFTVTARNKSKLALSPLQEHEWVCLWLLFQVSAVTVDTFLAAKLIHARFQISHWDSLILASAKAAGCDIVYSENLGDQQDYDGVKVVNPFI